jgi:dTDP-4-dehydrorhamnose reductase
MKALVTGARGMLGHDLCPVLEDEGYEVIETDISILDITDFEAIQNFFKREKPDVVVHCAAYTNVDKAQVEFELARKIKRQRYGKYCTCSAGNWRYFSLYFNRLRV